MLRTDVSPVYFDQPISFQKAGGLGRWTIFHCPDEVASLVFLAVQVEAIPLKVRPFAENAQACFYVDHLHEKEDNSFHRSAENPQVRSYWNLTQKIGNIVKVMNNKGWCLIIN